LEFYVLAPWVRVFGPAAGTVIGVASVNLVCILTVAWLAFRRGQHLALLVAMATMALLGWSVGSEMLFDPWPPHVTLFPFAVVMVAGWAVADRDLTSGLTIAAVVAGLTVFGMANAPVNLGLRTVVYLKFAWVTAAFVTMMLVLAALDELKGRRRWFTDVPAPLAFMTVAVAAGLLALPRVDRADTGSEISEETRDLADAVLAAVRDQGTVLIEMDQPMSRVTWYRPGVLAELVGAGVPIVTRDPVLVAQLGDDREYRGSADLRLYIIPGEGPPMFSPGAQFVGSASRPARADDEELARRLRRRLRAALDRAGGLPIEDPDAVAEAVGRVPGYTNQFDVRRLVEQVRDLGPDPDAILDSTTTWGLVYLLDTLGVAYDMIDDDFPVDDLVRYGGLRDPADGPEVTVWLDHLD
jgi:hypothetical protein